MEVNIPGCQGYKVLIHANKFYIYFLKDLYSGMSCQNLRKLVLTTCLKFLFTRTKIDLLNFFFFTGQQGSQLITRNYCCPVKVPA